MQTKMHYQRACSQVNISRKCYMCTSSKKWGMTNNAPYRVNSDSLLNHELRVTKFSKHARILMRHLATDNHEKCPNDHEFMEKFVPELPILDGLLLTNFRRKRSYSSLSIRQYYLYYTVQKYTTKYLVYSDRYRTSCERERRERDLQ